MSNQKCIVGPGWQNLFQSTNFSTSDRRFVLISYFVVMNLGDLLKYHILFMEWKVPKAEQSAPTHTTHIVSQVYNESTI